VETYYKLDGTVPGIEFCGSDGFVHSSWLKD
jgi:hypothetical protein